MEKGYLSRKLAVILHADVVGSTRLVQKNEVIAHQRIRDAFQRFSKVITSYGGFAHEIRGDALVAELRGHLTQYVRLYHIRPKIQSITMNWQTTFDPKFELESVSAKSL